MKTHKADLYVNANSDLLEDFLGVVVVDDDATLCRMTCESLIDQFRNIVVLGLNHPGVCPPIIQRLYLDALISDINMPGLWGDKLIAHLKDASPTTFTIAMTGCGMETAYAAGKASPDFFFDKSRGMDTLLSSIAEGFRESKRRRDRIFMKFLNESGELAPIKKQHWRERAELKNLLGYSLTEYLQSRKNVNALALLKLKKTMTLEDITIFSGHSSSQRLKENMAVLEPFVNVPKR